MGTIEEIKESEEVGFYDPQMPPAYLSDEESKEFMQLYEEWFQTWYSCWADSSTDVNDFYAKLNLKVLQVGKQETYIFKDNYHGDGESEEDNAFMISVTQYDDADTSIEGFGCERCLGTPRIEIFDE